MDWNKTKSIFIVVFLILNVFLYAQYLSSYNEAQKVEVLSEKKIDAMLKDDNIRYSSLPENIESAPYISTKVRVFTTADVPNSNTQEGRIVNDKALHVSFIKPVVLGNSVTRENVMEFARTYIKGGENYMLWEIDEEKRSALLFQKVDNQTFYYNLNGHVRIYWNEKNEITNYEQTMLEKVEALEQQEPVLPPIKMIELLYTRNLLKPDSEVTSMKLGYSTLVQITETQVFTPTWEIRVKPDEGNEEVFFINAVAGKIIELGFDDKSTSDVLTD